MLKSDRMPVHFVTAIGCKNRRITQMATNWAPLLFWVEREVPWQDYWDEVTHVAHTCTEFIAMQQGKLLSDYLELKQHKITHKEFHSLLYALPRTEKSSWRSIALMKSELERDKVVA